MLFALFFSLSAQAQPPIQFPRPPVNDCRTVPCEEGSQCFGAMNRFFCVQMPDCSQGCGPGETCVELSVGPRCMLGGGHE